MRTLELPFGAAALFHQLKPWPRMRWVHRLGLGSLLTFPSWQLTCRSGAIGFVSVASADTESFLNGGRAFQRIWLAATRAGLALQPLGSLPIFLAHLSQLRGEKLAPPQVRAVRRLRARWNRLMPAIERQTLLMAFRVGVARPPSCRSLRRPVAEFLAQ